MTDTLKRDHILHILATLHQKLKRDRKSGERFGGATDGSALDRRIQLGSESIEILRDVEVIDIGD